MHACKYFRCSCKSSIYAFDGSKSSAGRLVNLHIYVVSNLTLNNLYQLLSYIHMAQILILDDKVNGPTIYNGINQSHHSSIISETTNAIKPETFSFCFFQSYTSSLRVQYLHVIKSLVRQQQQCHPKEFILYMYFNSYNSI